MVSSMAEYERTPALRRIRNEEKKKKKEKNDPCDAPKWMMMMMMVDCRVRMYSMCTVP